MQPQEILDRWSQQAGWSPEERLDVLCRFIEGRGLSRELDGFLAADVLAGRLSADEIDPECLDELVHEAAAQCASAVNNGGPGEQLGFLIEQWGVSAATEAVEQLLNGRPDEAE